jgi:RES domain-containing protein
VDRNLANAVARCGTTRVEGTFYRHASTNIVGLAGSAAGGRWGPPGAYPVLYLGRPVASVVVEAYRHLVDPFPGMTGEMVAPRRLYTCQLDVGEVLDLRTPENLAAVGLTPEDLRGPHARCQEIGAAAHQLALHGVLAPAATELGETLAVFMRHLLDAEQPTVTAEELWDELPADPRRFRVISGQAG